jgi:hypothetical protein
MVQSGWLAKVHRSRTAQSRRDHRAERGATTDQLKAIFGWSTHEQPDLDTKAAEQKRLAAGAMPLLRREIS